MVSLSSSNKTVSSNSTEKSDQQEHLENACAHLVSNCLLQILPDTQESSNLFMSDRNKSVLSEKLVDNFENSGSNKKAKVEVEWTWDLVVSELKDCKDTSKQISWSLITEKLIESECVPEGFLFNIIDFIMEKIDIINLDNPFSVGNNRKTINSVNNLNSFTFQAIYFQIYYTILKSVSTQKILQAQMNSTNVSSLLTKTGLFFLKNVSRNSRFVDFLSNMVELSYSMDSSFYRASIDKLNSLLTNLSVIKIDLGLLKFFAKTLELNQAHSVVTKDLRDSLIDKILVSFSPLIALGKLEQNKSLYSSDEDEMSENCPKQTCFLSQKTGSSKKSDTSTANTAVITSLSNLSRSQMFTYFYVARILTQLADITSDKIRRCLENPIECLSGHVKILFPSVYPKRTVDDKLALLFESVHQFYEQPHHAG